MPTTDSTHVPNGHGASQRPSLAGPLQPRPDQRQHWLTPHTPSPFVDAAAHVLEAHAADGARQDQALYDLRTWAFGSADQKTMQLLPVPLPGRQRSEPLALRELAFAQLCKRIAAPAPYIRDLPRNLQLACMNWGLATAHQNGLLRLAGGEVRALLSEKYAPIDDTFLLDVVDTVLTSSGHRDDALVRQISTGPHTLLRVTVPTGGVAVRRDDIIEWGIDIANSELGLRSVQVTPITYRLICTNGMRAWQSQSALRMRHIGDPDRLHEQLREVVPVALAEARQDIARWRRASNQLIDNAWAEIESLRSFGLGKLDVQAVGQSLAQEIWPLAESKPSPDQLPCQLKVSTTPFDVANAITATARNRTDITSRLSLEEVGHRYLVRSTR